MKIDKNSAGNIVLSTDSDKIITVIPPGQYIHLSRIQPNILYISENSGEYSGVNRITINSSEVSSAFGTPFSGDRDALVKLLGENFNSGSGGGELDPSSYDLAEFKNESADVFVRMSDLNDLSGIETISSESTFVTIDNSDAKNPKLETNLQNADGDASYTKRVVAKEDGTMGIVTGSGGSTETDPIFSASPAHDITTSDVTFLQGKDYNLLNNKPDLSAFAPINEPIFANSPARSLTANDITFIQGKDYNSLNNKPVIPSVVKQFGTTYTKEWVGSITTGTSSAVFNIASAGFINIIGVFITTELAGATSNNAPIGVVTSKSLTSITVSLFESKETLVLILNTNVDGLEAHAVANTIVYLRVIGN
ncbi:hypothetical protein [Elizabethkingia ursingii]|uniref:hypothetical protein n=1 Tax=Elizabethkingia ursingii TaxID=1756150 RepID=UPI000750D967|nr:hypothetical protein [Elizabethkingia ursingii]KUY29387.1 hypothetical protein ATB96_18905 [Elizabethkingia ursingii]